MTQNLLPNSFADYVLKHHKDDLRNIFKSSNDVQHYSVHVNFVTLFEEYIELGNGILSESEKYLEICDKGLIIAQQKLVNEEGGDVNVKQKVHTRVTALPSCPELHRTVFPRNNDIGSFLKVCGTIVKVSSPKMLEYQRDYICSKCKNIQTKQAVYELYYSLQPPTTCLSDGCTGSNFTPVTVEGQFYFKDYQEVKIQEQVSKLEVGTMPQSMWLTLEDDLVDTVKPGDDVVICGTVLRRWKSLNIGIRCDIELVMKVNNLQICNDQKSTILINDETKQEFTDYWKKYEYCPLAGRNRIIASFCSQVYGLFLVKLSVAVVLAGGVTKSDTNGCKVRGESHLLLVGDPGTAKSHILRFASKIIPRSVLTAGVGSTSAGLTVTAVREGAEWQLEAGALVLADGGICCIDEFNSIREHDRTSIHEAMEQQTISVAKAGIVTKLNSRCTILAATNPKGNYDPHQPMSVNVALATPLLSRFDLVLVLLDTMNQDWDRLVSSFILNGRHEYVQTAQTCKNIHEDLWNLDKLQIYFSLIKHLDPVMCQESNIVLSKYYQVQRLAEGRNVARTTVRMLESLVRLSQGHARLMFRSKVTLEDAVVAISLAESSMQSASIIPGVNTLHAAFPEDPVAEYRNQVELILNKLGLQDLLQRELVRLDELKREETQNEDGKNIASQTTTRKTQHSENITQQLSRVLTDIKRKKNEDVYNTINHQKIKKVKENKIKQNLPNNNEDVEFENKEKNKKKRKYGRIIIESDDEQDDDERREILKNSTKENEESVVKETFGEKNENLPVELEKNEVKIKNKPENKTSSEKEHEKRREIVKMNKTQSVSLNLDQSVIDNSHLGTNSFKPKQKVNSSIIDKLSIFKKVEPVVDNHVDDLVVKNASQSSVFSLDSVSSSVEHNTNPELSSQTSGHFSLEEFGWDDIQLNL